MSAKLTDMQQAAELLTTLFDPGDATLVRPIEIWTEGDRKRSRVDYKGVEYLRHGVRNGSGMWVPHTDGLVDVLKRVVDRTRTTRANAFFGACPRFDAERFDEAWQVRTVRSVWADIDDTEGEDDIIGRCVVADLPEPSAIVATGHGAHAYWLLREPYLIDDVDDPAAVFTDFVEVGEKLKPQKYIKDPETGEKLSLEGRHNIPLLSEKALYLQDVLAGVAASIGGDHTTDLARLLRIPGTLNRKNERNGDQPTPCRLLYLHSDQRHAISDFEHVVEESPTRKRRAQVEQIQVPTPKKMTATKRDKLNELAAACAIAPVGSRSEVDWALVCVAVEKGFPREEVWEAVQNVGKFAEAGRRYFDRTWDRAEYHTKELAFVRLEKKQRGKSRSAPAGGIDDVDTDTAGDHPAIRIDPETQDVSVLVCLITDHMARAGCYYHRAGIPVAVYDEHVIAIETPQQLAGLLVTIVEFRLVGSEGDRTEPLPIRYASAWLHHPHEFQRLPEITVWTTNPIYVQGWRLVEPGYDRETGTFYAGPRVEPRDTTGHLDRVLAEFCFSTPADRSNYVGLLLTTLLVSKFRESKPAGLFTANQAAVGKTMLAQIVAIIRSGRTVQTATYIRDDTELEKRLGAIVHDGATTIILDNAKSTRGGRSAFITSACLERAITDPIISFRLLGHSANIRVENSHIFLITANTPHVGRDLITRSIPIQLWHDGDPTKRRFELADPEGYAQQHRTEILGELLGMVERWKTAGMTLADLGHRFNKRGWANVVGGILQATGYSDFLANLDEAAAEFDQQRQDVSEMVAHMAMEPDQEYRATDLVEVCETAELLAGDISGGKKIRSARSKSTRLGVVMSQYVNEQFEVIEGKYAILRTRKLGGYTMYYVDLA